MEEESELDPDERAFRADVADARFVAGVSAGRWRIVAYSWPFVVFGIVAAPRKNSPREFFLRSNLAGYPFVAPTSTPWDQAQNQQLPAAARPKGERVGRVFRVDWENGRALYAPYDRVALSSHPNWKQEHPEHAWTDQRDITWFLSVVSDLLNNDDYLGI